MSVKVVKPEGAVVFQQTDVRSIAFDWDKRSLRADITITSSSFAIAVIEQNGATALTKDNEDILSAAEATVVCERTVEDNDRVTQVRLIATTATSGDEYWVSNVVVTSDAPTQTKTQRVRILIQ